MSHFTTLNLSTFAEPRGSLKVFERALPFKVVRTYRIYGAIALTLGGHRQTHTRGTGGSEPPGRDVHE